jgi:hypothetical protein
MKTSDDFPVATGLEHSFADIRRQYIDLTDEEMDRGRRIRDAVIEAVCLLDSRFPGFPHLIEGEAFLAGSFGRRTQAQPLDDVDIFFPIEGSELRMLAPGLQPTPERLDAGQSLAPTLGSQESLFTSERWLDSRLVLSCFGQGLFNTVLDVEDAGIKARCGFVVIDGVNVDVVPVLVSDSPSGKRFHLPGGLETPHWRATNPKKDQLRLTTENTTRHFGKLLPTVRAMKAWNDHACRGRLKSVHLEMLLTESVFSGVQIDSVISGVLFALAHLPEHLSHRCADPTGLGDELDVNLNDEDRKWVIERAQLDTQSALAANKLARTDLDRGCADLAEVILKSGAKAPQRDRPSRAPRHDVDFGQPASTRAGVVGVAPSSAVPAAVKSDLQRAPDQSRRRPEYA